MTIEVQLSTRRARVKAYYKRGCLAVTPVVDMDGKVSRSRFVVTHVPSGYKVCPYGLTRAEANAYLTRLVRDPRMNALARMTATSPLKEKLRLGKIAREHLERISEGPA